jgi:hypothetical protein
MKTFRKSKKNKKNKKNRKSSKINNKTKKTRFKSRGGMGFGIGNLNIFSKSNQSNKYYDWKSGKWLNQDCYNVLGMPFCTTPHS